MKLKCKKIYGVEKSVCTYEQKIAYNYAFSWYDIYKMACKKCSTEMQKSDVLQDIIKKVVADINSREEMKKYNIDAIIIAFRQGFNNYCNDFFIAFDYKKIGEVFKIPYEII